MFAALFSELWMKVFMDSMSIDEVRAVRSVACNTAGQIILPDAANTPRRRA
ncbi:MAG: hypothetical protein RLP96_10575 [Alphaproteobacteria bacterium]